MQKPKLSETAFKNYCLQKTAAGHAYSEIYGCTALQQDTKLHLLNKVFPGASVLEQYDLGGKMILCLKMIDNAIIRFSICPLGIWLYKEVPTAIIIKKPVFNPALTLF